MANEGVLGAAGALHLNLNPPTAAESGAVFDAAWVRVEVDSDGNFTTRLFGQAIYDAPDGGKDTAGNPTMQKRTVTVHEDLTDAGLSPLKDALNQVLAAYNDGIKAKALAAAYEARTFAHNTDRPQGGK